MLDTILVIDDDESLRRVIEFTLKREGHRVVVCPNGREGLKEFDRIKPCIVITDVELGDISGYDILREIKRKCTETLVVMITGYGSIENAVEAMKLGAYDYLGKPFSTEQLITLLSQATREMGRRGHHSLQRRNSGNTIPLPMIGESEKMRALVALTRRVAASDATALVLGESGTGKELVARAIHHASVRANGPFVPVNCAAIPKDLLESELFGHQKGAFTGAVKERRGKFQLACGGTIFLDEIGELPLELQPKLLRVLQERVVEALGGGSVAVDARVVAATNVDIEAAVAKGRFREDLYYRLAVLPLTLPALRSRREDIPLLFRHFVGKHGRGREIAVADSAMECLQAYHWPGNVRELENVVERLLVLCPTSVVEEKHLPPQVRLNSEIKSKGVLNLPLQGFPLDVLEKEAVMQALVMNDWNQTRAAEFLRIPRHVLKYRMEKYGLKR